MILTQIARSRFKQSKISLLISHIYVSGCFYGNFFGDFWLHLGIKRFSQRRSETYENKTFLNVVLKKELEVKIGTRKPNSCPTICFKTFFLIPLNFALIP